ncbi:hypothetical protein SK128_016394, partial [Halocaridina rubra]
MKVPKEDGAKIEVKDSGIPLSSDGHEWEVKGGEEGGEGGGDEEEEEAEEESVGGVYARLGSDTRSPSSSIKPKVKKDSEDREGLHANASSISSSPWSRRQGYQEEPEPERRHSMPLPPAEQQVSGQNLPYPTTTTTSVNAGGPRRRSSAYTHGEEDGSVHHHGKTRAKGLLIPTSAAVASGTQGAAGRPASICDPIRQTVPMSFIHDSHTETSGTQAPNIYSSSPVARPRPTSLNIGQESSLLKELRRSSPVEALKDHFLSRVTPSGVVSSGENEVYYIPVELEASKRLTLKSESKREEKPLSPASAQSPLSLNTPASNLPLHERRGKGLQNLVIENNSDDDEVSSQVSARATCDDDKRSDITSKSESSDQWKPTEDRKSVENSECLRSAGPLSAGGRDNSLLQGTQPLQDNKLTDSPILPSVNESISDRGSKGVSHRTSLRRQRSPSPPETEPDVDEIISQAERVIEETKRLSASITNELPVENDLNRENYQSRFKANKITKDKLQPTFNLAPNIDTRFSPESNFVEVLDEQHEDREEEEKEESEGESENEIVKRKNDENSDAVVEGCLTIPLPGLAGRPQPQPPRYKPMNQPTVTPPPSATTTKTTRAKGSRKSAHPESLTIEALEDSDDVIVCEEVRPTIVTSPEIQSSDDMGCARDRGRRDGRIKGMVIPSDPRDMPPPPSPPHEAQPLLRASRQTAASPAAAAASAATPARDGDSIMGGVFSRSRTHNTAGRHPPSPTSNVNFTPTGTAKGATTPQSPTTASPRIRDRSISKEEPPLPPYVRQKPEPTKRYSGFGHVQSDNVRKMRDVWGARNEPPTPTPPTPPTRPSRVPPSPPPVPRREAHSPRRAPDSPRRFSDTPKFDSYKYRTESPKRVQEFSNRVPEFTSRRGSDTSRKAPESPRGAPESPRRGPESPRRVPDSPKRAPDSPRRGPDSPRRAQDSPKRGPDSPRRAPDSPKRGPESPKRSFFSRDSPTRDSGRSSKNTNTNFYSSTISSRNKASSSPRRGSTSSNEGGTTGPSGQPSGTRLSEPQPEKTRTHGSAAGGRGGWPSSTTPTSSSPTRASRRASTPPPPQPSPSAPPSAASAPPPASTFHHKVFKKLRDSSLQPDSETICFRDEEDRYK